MKVRAELKRRFENPDFPASSKSINVEAAWKDKKTEPPQDKRDL